MVTMTAPAAWPTASTARTTTGFLVLTRIDPLPFKLHEQVWDQLGQLKSELFTLTGCDFAKRTNCHPSTGSWPALYTELFTTLLVPEVHRGQLMEIKETCIPVSESIARILSDRQSSFRICVTESMFERSECYLRRPAIGEVTSTLSADLSPYPIGMSIRFRLNDDTYAHSKILSVCTQGAHEQLVITPVQHGIALITAIHRAVGLYPWAAYAVYPAPDREGAYYPRFYRPIMEITPCP